LIPISRTSGDPRLQLAPQLFLKWVSALNMKIINKKDFSPKDLPKIIATVIKSDGLVVMPSDTVYGLCVNTNSKKAVDKLLMFKDRPAGKAISIFTGDVERASKYVLMNENQKAIMTRIGSGAFTFVLPALGKVDKRLESEKKTLGVRIPDFPLIKDVVNELDFPITATSANVAGASHHYSIESLLNSLRKKKQGEIDLIVDFGKLPRVKPSTVVDLTEEDVSVLRVGEESVSETFLSNSEEDTKKIAVCIFKKIVKKAKSKSIVFILHGELGAGKTAFVKGIGETLGIKNIVSPTYVICYEYKIDHPHIKHFHHCDFFNVAENEELSYIGIEEMLSEKSLLLIEWGEKSGPIYKLLKKDSVVVLIKIKYVTETRRQITSTYL